MIQKTEIENFLWDQRKSSILNHLSLLTNKGKYYGEVRESEILVWGNHDSLFPFYKIFKLKFNESNNLSGIEVKANPLGRLLKIIIIIGYISIVFWRYNSVNFSVFLSSIIFLSVLLGFVLFTVYYYAKIENHRLKKQLQYHVDQIENKHESKDFGFHYDGFKKEKEKSFTFIAARLLLYPFSIIIVLVSIFVFYPDKKYVISIAGILIGLGYIVSDLMILIRSRKNNNS